MPLPPGSRPAARAPMSWRVARGSIPRRPTRRDADAARFARVSEIEEDEVTVRVVAELQAEAPFERLAVADPRLCLDPGAPPLWVAAAAADLRVPRPEVTFDRERHLGSPAEPRMEPHSQSLEERELRPIPDRVPGRVCADHEIHPDHGAVGAEERKVRRINLVPLEPSHLGVRDPNGFGHICLAESGRQSRAPKIVRESPHGVSASSSPSIGGSVACWHPLTAWRVALRWLLPPASRTPSVRNDRWARHQRLPRTPSVRNGGGRAISAGVSASRRSLGTLSVQGVAE